MIPLIFIALYATFYAVLGACLILRGVGLWQERESQVTVSMPYPKIDNPPAR